MDIRTGRTYASKLDALAAGVPESDVAEIEVTREGPNPKFSNPKYQSRHQGAP